MINQDSLEDLFKEYFDDVNPKDGFTIRGCIDDFVDESMRTAKAEAQQYLDEHLLTNYELEE